jgi:hypothetical protein
MHSAAEVFDPRAEEVFKFLQVSGISNLGKGLAALLARLLASSTCGWLNNETPSGLQCELVLQVDD